MQRWRRGNSLEFPLKASFDKEQEEARREGVLTGETPEPTRLHTMGVWRAQTCQVSCRDEAGQWRPGEVPS